MALTALAVLLLPLPSGAERVTQVAPVAPVTKVLVVVVENHSLAQMRDQMPYTFGLAQRYGYATSWKAARHPSLPNYLAMLSGSTHNVRNDLPPSDNRVAGPSVFGQAIAAGGTARLYAESMIGSCRLTSNNGGYVVKHNPWTYFIDESAQCRNYDVPLPQLNTDAVAGTLPNVGMVIPNQNNNGHNGPLATTDTWLQSRMQTIFAGPDWQSGHLAVILTADEDDKLSGNIVLTVVIHPSQNGVVVSTPMTHYSLTRFIEDVNHVPYLNNAATAIDMAATFGLPLS
jgi:acid phosphatase